MKSPWILLLSLAIIGGVAVIVLFRPAATPIMVQKSVSGVAPSLLLNTNYNAPTLVNAAIIPVGANPHASQSVPTNNNVNVIQNINVVSSTTRVTVPMADFFDRIIKKPFGLFVTPQVSPIQPEKFTGYHTGADAETTADETDVDIPVYSIAGGTVVFAGHVNGYGGVILIQSKINSETITVLYGHLRISSFVNKQGNAVQMGEQIAVLGRGFSTETDGERKHLHLGIIKGATINYQGYVATKSALSGWEDPVLWLKSDGSQ